MDLQKFIDKWSGKHIDFDGIYPNQCMDLMHQYVYEVLGLTDAKILAAPSAYQVFTNFDNITGRDLFEKIINTPDAVAQPGDIVIFGTAIGPHGHIAIVVKADKNNLTSFDSNWPVGSLPKLVEHKNYNGVVGWLRYKGEPAEAQITIPATQRDWLVWRATIAKEVAEYLGINNPDQASTADYKSVIGGIKSTQTALQTELNKEVEEHKKTKSELGNRVEQVSRLKTEVTDAAGREKTLTEQLNKAGQNTTLAIKVYQEQLKMRQDQIGTLSREKGEAINRATEWQAKYDTLSNQVKHDSSKALTLYDILILLIKKTIPFLKNVKLEK